MESTFDPRKPGTLSVILDANNVTYYIDRAIEFLRAAKSNYLTTAKLQIRVDAEDVRVRDEAFAYVLTDLTQAISLLAMSKSQVLDESIPSPAKSRKSKRKTSNGSVSEIGESGPVQSNINGTSTTDRETERGDQSPHKIGTTVNGLDFVS